MVQHRLVCSCLYFLGISFSDFMTADYCTMLAGTSTVPRTRTRVSCHWVGHPAGYEKDSTKQQKSIEITIRKCNDWFSISTFCLSLPSYPMKELTFRQWVKVMAMSLWFLYVFHLCSHGAMVPRSVNSLTLIRHWHHTWIYLNGLLIDTTSSKFCNVNHPPMSYAGNLWRLLECLLM